jgi:hypothetical protein
MARYLPQDIRGVLQSALRSKSEQQSQQVYHPAAADDGTVKVLRHLSEGEMPGLTVKLACRVLLRLELVRVLILQGLSTLLIAECGD